MIIVIVGPTGVGKTKLSIELAKKYDAEIINGDSLQIYKKLDIATAKIKEEEKLGIKHHLIDIKEKEENYTVYDYQRDGRNVIDNHISQNKNIIIVGGTGLYIKALLYDYRFKKEEENNLYDEYTNEELYSKVKDYNTNIHINNRKRLIRFLNKVNNNSVEEKLGDVKLYDFKIIGLTTPRDNLYNIINHRVDKMISDGLIDEAKNFYNEKAFYRSVITAIGYKELFKYFDNEITLDEAVELIKKNSRNYAKRQYTFFNNKFDVSWVNVDYNNFSNTIASSIKIIEDGFDE